MIARTRSVGVLVAAVAFAAGACASAPPTVVSTAPRYPSYPTPVVPASLAAPAAVESRHEAAWQRLQAGDLDGAAREFQRLLVGVPGFYPAAAGWGFAALAGRDYDQAGDLFERALAADDAYLPAWQGLATTRLEQGREADALRPLERIAALDPSRAPELRSRIELLRFHQVQALIEASRRSREAGRLPEATEALERALELSPTSGVILRELAAVERERGDLDEALVYARGAVALDAADPEAYAMLASVLEARGDLAGAADAFARAASIDDRGGWARRSAELAGRAHLAALPPEMQTVADAPTISRAQAATLIGLRLEALLAAAPRRVTAVATDVRGHWAASWILPVTEAGVMEIFPNHTFQPSSPVRRSDLARIVNELLGLAAVSRPSDLARWRAATVRFVDLPATHLIYRAAATSVAAGAMTLDADRFQPTREVTGAELLAAVARIEQLADR